MTGEQKKQSDENLARLALALDTPPPAGDKPELEEITQWWMGRVSEPRATEIKAFVARDPDCYQMWYDLRQAQDVAGQKTDRPAAVGAGKTGLLKKFSDLFGTGLFAPATATVFAALLLVLVATPMLYSPDLREQIDNEYDAWDYTTRLSASDYPWLHQHGQLRALSVNRSATMRGPASLSRITIYQYPSFAFGVREGMEKMIERQSDTELWHSYIAQLPGQPADCPDADPHCNEDQLVLSELGRWSVLMQAQCVLGLRNPVGKRLLTADFNERIKARPSLEPFSESVETLTQVVESNDPLGFCRNVNRLVTVGLSARP